MQKLFITGGAGFIGSQTVLELLRFDSNLEITVYDNFTNGNRAAIKKIKSKFPESSIDVIEGDVLNFDKLANALSKKDYDAVIHFAALIEAGKSMSTPTRFFETNISGTINLIKAMQEKQIRKLVFSSTAAVYGSPDNPEVFESTSYSPENWYGFSKYVVEELITAITAESAKSSEKIDTMVLRYFNAAGADPEGVLGQDYPNPTHLITLAIETALDRRDKLIVFGNDYPTPDGTCIRDYIHVQDLARAHVKALEFINSREGQNPDKHVVNVGTGKGTSNLEVIKALEEIHGEFPWEFGERRHGDPVAFFANNQKAKNLLNWEPKYSLNETVKHAYDWHKNNPNGYESTK
jgi:UDP-glucose 4-epimerase